MSETTHGFVTVGRFERESDRNVRKGKKLYFYVNGRHVLCGSYVDHAISMESDGYDLVQYTDLMGKKKHLHENKIYIKVKFRPRY